MPLEMLKMKEPPGICMKTKDNDKMYTPKNGLFTRKCVN